MILTDWILRFGAQMRGFVAWPAGLPTGEAVEILLLKARPDCPLKGRRILISLEFASFSGDRVTPRGAGRPVAVWSAARPEPRPPCASERAHASSSIRRPGCSSLHSSSRSEVSRVCCDISMVCIIPPLGRGPPDRLQAHRLSARRIPGSLVQRAKRLQDLVDGDRRFPRARGSTVTCPVAATKQRCARRRSRSGGLNEFHQYLKSGRQNDSPNGGIAASYRFRLIPALHDRG